LTEHKEAQLETARLANEVRILKMDEDKNLSPRPKGILTPKVSASK